MPGAFCCYSRAAMATEFELEALPKEPAKDGERCVVRARVPADLRYLEGHFPGHPIVPGIAQLLPLVYEPARSIWPDLPSPSSIKRLKFLEALRPGDELEVHLVRQPARLRFEIRRGDLICSLGTLTFD